MKQIDVTYNNMEQQILDVSWVYTITSNLIWSRLWLDYHFKIIFWLNGPTLSQVNCHCFLYVSW